jgi:hypothetical protein
MKANASFRKPRRCIGWGLSVYPPQTALPAFVFVLIFIVFSFLLNFLKLVESG